MSDLINMLKNTRAKLLTEFKNTENKLQPVIFLCFRNKNQEFDIGINLLDENKLWNLKSIVSNLATKTWGFESSDFFENLRESHLAYFCSYNKYQELDYHYCFDYDNKKITEYIINKKQQEVVSKQSTLSNLVFFDTETTGLPKDYDKPITDLENWPRLVQLAWQLFDKNGVFIEKKNYIIKPEGFKIPAKSSEIHKIFHHQALIDGKSLKDVLSEFSQDVQNTFYIVGHNINFDYKILGAEFLRVNLYNPLIEKPQICTMKSSTNFCKIKNKQGYKWPSLGELYFKLFNKNFNESHNAEFDIEVTQKCFWKLQELEIIKTGYNTV